MQCVISKIRYPNSDRVNAVDHAIFWVWKLGSVRCACKKAEEPERSPADRCPHTHGAQRPMPPQEQWLLPWMHPPPLGIETQNLPTKFSQKQV